MLGDLVKELFPLFFDSAKSGIRAFRNHKQNVQHVFMLDAIGEVSCLAPSESAKGFVSLESVERRVRCAQENAPGYAKRCHIPDVKDPHRVEKLQQILQDMTKDGTLKYRPVGYWKLM